MDLLNEPEGMEYEHACQLIDQELSRYEAMIEEEMGKDTPDAGLIEEYRHVEQHLLAQRESLNWQDHRTADDVINHFEPAPMRLGDH